MHFFWTMLEWEQKHSDLMQEFSAFNFEKSCLRIVVLPCLKSENAHMNLEEKKKVLRKLNFSSILCRDALKSLIKSFQKAVSSQKQIIESLITRYRKNSGKNILMSTLEYHYIWK